MFLADAADTLLPEWAFFVQVVVNADDLRPTASREGFYEDAKLAKASRAVGDALRAYLIELAERRPERLERFLAIHHRAIKALAVEDDEFYKLVIDWLPFETSLGQMRFGEFRQQTDRIRYVPDLDSFRQIARVAAAQGVPVVNAGYIYDAELLAKAGDAFPGLAVEAVDPTAVAREFDDLSLDEQEAAHDFLRAADAALRPYRCTAEAKAFAPAELPALYNTSAEGRFFRSLEQSREVANPLFAGVLDSLGKRERASVATAQLCFNFRNPLVRRLAAVADEKRPGPGGADAVCAGAAARPPPAQLEGAGAAERRAAGDDRRLGRRGPGMTGGDRAELERLAMEAADLPGGPAKVALWELAAAAADRLQDVEAGFYCRMELVGAALDTSRGDRMAPAFAWCVAQYDRDPDRFPHFNLLWRYRWAVSELSNYPQIAKAYIEGMLADMARRYEAAGASLRAVHMLRLVLGRSCGA